MRVRKGGPFARRATATKRVICSSLDGPLQSASLRHDTLPGPPCFEASSLSVRCFSCLQKAGLAPSKVVPCRVWEPECV